ncbi:protein of unknown function [Nitrospina watsonii]|uniref:Uncharacterized protein n=1 Tax=Nitrospina watsonii TaxID=1323948 RepID=A0ABM9HFY8_9BACT|nr:protein of unknown function [Nitrospina watsonii]
MCPQGLSEAKGVVSNLLFLQFLKSCYTGLHSNEAKGRKGLSEFMSSVNRRMVEIMDNRARVGGCNGVRRHVSDEIRKWREVRS